MSSNFLKNNNENQNSSRGSKVDLNNLMRFKPKEVIDEGVKPKQEEEEQKAPSLLSSLTKGGADKEKLEVINSYKSLANLQIDSSTIVADDVKEKVLEIGKSTIDMDKIKAVTEPLTLRESQNTNLARRNYLDDVLNTISSTALWISSDIQNKFVSKLNEIENLETENVELVREIRFGLDTVTYITDEGEYTYNSKEVAKFGGYLVLDFDLFGVNYNLKELLSKTSRGQTKSKERAEKDLAYAYVMMELFMGKTSNGKTLLMNSGALLNAMKYYKEMNLTDSAKKTETLKSAKDSKQYAREVCSIGTLDKIFYDIDTFSENIIENALISFNYFSLVDFGIKFSFEVEGLDINAPVKLREDFIEFNTLKRMKYEDKYIRSIADIRKNLYLAKENEFNTYFDCIEDFHRDSFIQSQGLSPSRVEDGEYSERFFAETSTSRIVELFKLNLVVNGLGIELKGKDEVVDDEDVTEVNQVTLGEYNLTAGRMEKLDAKYDNYMDKIVKYFETLESIPAHKEADIMRMLEGLNHTVNFERHSVIEHLNQLYERLSSISLNLEDYIVAHYISLREGIHVINLITEFKAVDKRNWVATHPSLSPYYEIYKNKLDEIQKSIERCKRALEDSIREYKKLREKYLTIHSLQSNMKPNNLRFIECKVDVGTEVDLAGIILANLSKSPYWNELNRIISKSTVPLIHPPRQTTYNMVVDIIKKFVNSPISCKNWLEIIKMFEAESAKSLSLIRYVPEISTLTSISSMLDQLNKLNTRKKFRKVDPNVTWEDVMNYKTEMLPELSMNEERFNDLFNELIRDYKGLICSVGYEKLATYLCSTLPENYSGKEISKYIPAPLLVHKYFPIEDSVVAFKPSNNPYKDIGYLPPAIVGVNKIMRTCEEYLINKENMQDNYNKFAEDVLNYRRKVISIQSKSDGKTDNAGIGEARIRLERMNDRYEKIFTNLRASGRISGNVSFVKYSLETENEFNEFRNSIKDIENEDLKNLEKYADSIIERYKSKLNLARESELEVLEEQYQESLTLKKKASESIDKYLEGLVEIIGEHYSLDNSKKRLTNLLFKYKIDKIRKTRVAANYMFTITKNLPEEVASAWIELVIEFMLLVCKEPVGETPIMVETICRNHENLVDILGITSSLRLSDTEILEISNNIESEKTKELSEEDIKILEEFFLEIAQIPKDDRHKMVRQFERKDLLSGLAYENLAYPYENTKRYAEIYEDFYSEDFSLAENIKLRQIFNFPINPEHQDDEKLMEIASEIEFGEETIKELKEDLES